MKSQKDENAESKKRRFCRAGAGIEEDFGHCNTPGFKLRKEPEAVYDPRNFWTIPLERNHKRLLQSSMFLIQSNRANGDVGFMIYDKNPMEPSSEEIRKVVGYIVDYASKANETEKQSRDSMKALIMAEKSISGGKWDMSRISIKSMNQLIKDKLCSKQETICLIAGLKLFDCSNTIEKININGYKAINADGKLTSSDKLSDYAHRNQHWDMSFFDWICQIKNKSLNGRTYIPHFVGTHTQATYPITEEYAKMVLLVYKPWHGNFANMLLGDKPILELYNDFHSSSNCPKLVRMEYNRALDNYKSQYTEPQVATGNEPPEGAEQDLNTDPDTAEAIQLYGTLCANVDNTNSDMEGLDLGLNYDWTVQHCSLPHNITPTQASTWIFDKLNDTEPVITDRHNTQDLLLGRENYNNADNNTLDIPTRSDGTPFKHEVLTSDQLQVFYYVMSALRQWIESNRSKKKRSDSMCYQQLLLTVAGEGGSGKSTLVKTLVGVIRQIFQENSTALVAAPTGSASFNGGGVTMHRLFGLPIGNSKGNLGADKEQRLKSTFRNVVMQVIDERSMISSEDMAMINEHTKKVVHQGTHPNDDFGGIPIVLLVGDDYQLPPIMPGVASAFSVASTKSKQKKGKDMAVTNSSSFGKRQNGGELFKRVGKKYIKLQTSKRVLKDQAFLTTCLKGVRGDSKNGLSESNIQKLMQYHLRSDYWTPEMVQQMENDEMTIHLFAKNDDKNEHNWKKLALLNSSHHPVAVIKSVTSGKCNMGNKDGHFDEERIPSMTMFCVGCKVALVGINIKPEWGLYHGAIGKVLDKEIIILNPISSLTREDKIQVVKVDPGRLPYAPSA